MSTGSRPTDSPARCRTGQRQPERVDAAGDRDLADIRADLLGGSFHAIVLAGNVMVYLSSGGEGRVLRSLAGALRPDGLLVAGFATDRDYGVAAFDRALGRLASSGC